MDATHEQVMEALAKIGENAQAYAALADTLAKAADTLRQAANMNCNMSIEYTNQRIGFVETKLVNTNHRLDQAGKIVKELQDEVFRPAAITQGGTLHSTT